MKRVWYADSQSPQSVRLPRELDRRRKLSEKDIEDIKQGYRDGDTSRYLAQKYSVSKTTILHHVNPNTKEKNNARARERNQLKWKTDKSFRDRQKKSRLEAFKRKKKLLPGFRKKIHEYEYRRRARKLKIFNK